MSLGYSPDNGSCPSADRGQAAVQYGYFNVRVAGIQILYNQHSHFHSLHRARLTSLPSEVHILNTSAKNSHSQLLQVARPVLSLILSTANARLYSATYPVSGVAITWQSCKICVYTLKPGVQKGLNIRPL